MRERPLCAVCLVFLCIIGMFVKAGVISGVGPDSSFTELAGNKEDSVLKGTVYRKEQKETYQILYLKNSQLQGKDSSGQLINCNIKSCILYDKTFKEIPLGGEIISRGRVKLFEAARNPGNFEQDFYYEKQGIAFAFQAGKLVLTKENRAPYYKLQTVLMKIRSKWQELLQKGAGEVNGAILGAILTGEKSEMSPEIKELYQKNGIGHILAISGLHVSFIGLGIYKFLRKTGRSFLASGVISLMILLLYMGMVGNSVSVVRAVIMLAIRTGADITGRTYDLPTSLAVAAAFTAVWRPLYLKDAAFLLSYGAILGILMMTPILGRIYQGKKKFIRTFLGGLGIQLFLLPVVLYFYCEIPPYSVFLNLVVIPLLSVVMGGAIAGSAVMLLGSIVHLQVTEWIFNAAGGLLLTGCGWILDFYKFLGELCMKFPGARIVCGKPGMWQIVLCYGIIFVLWRHAGSMEKSERRQKFMKASEKQKEKEEICSVKSRRLLSGIYVTALTAAIVLCAWNFHPNGELQITMIDVGQGDGIFVRTPSGTTILIDGGSSDIKNVGKYRIEPFLLSEGVRTLDYVFISHGDADHYSGVEEMIMRQRQGVRIKNLVLPAVWREHETLCGLAKVGMENGVRVLKAEPGMNVTEGNLQLTCIVPGKEDTDLDVNESSMVLKLCYEEFSMLLTGDIEGKGEERLCNLDALGQCSVLKAAHHGSENSTPEKFLEKTLPEIAFISAGIENSYGHPHPALLKRLGEYGIKIYQTPEHGAVILSTNGKKMKIKTYMR